MAEGNEETYHQVMELGFLSQEEADAAWIDHQDLQDGSAFADHLYQRALIDSDQLAQLLGVAPQEGAGEDLDVTMIGDHTPVEAAPPEDDPVIGRSSQAARF